MLAALGTKCIFKTMGIKEGDIPFPNFRIDPFILETKMGGRPYV